MAIEMTTRDEMKDMIRIMSTFVISSQDEANVAALCRDLQRDVDGGGTTDGVSWRTLLAGPLENKAVSDSLRSTSTVSNSNSNSEKLLRNCRVKYTRSVRIFLRIQMGFKSRQRTEFALLLRAQERSRRELFDARNKMIECRRKLLNSFYGPVRASSILSNLDSQEKSASLSTYQDVSTKSLTTEAASKIDSTLSRSDSSTNCPAGFDPEMWNSLPGKSKRVFLSQLPAVVRHCGGGKIFANRDTKVSPKRERGVFTSASPTLRDVEDDADTSLYDDLELLEEEREYVEQIRTKREGHVDVSDNTATIIETNVDGNPQSYRVRFNRTQRIAVFDVSELAVAMSGSGFERQKRVAVVKKILPSSRVTSSVVKNLLFAKDGTSRKRRDDAFVVVKADGELSAVLRVDQTSGIPKPIAIDVNVLTRLQEMKFVGEKEFFKLRERLESKKMDPLLDRTRLKKDDVVKVRPSILTGDEDRGDAVESNVNDRLITIRDDISSMNRDVEMMDSNMTTDGGDDLENRWCWQRWWTPMASVSQDSHIATSINGDVAASGASATSPCCFCWGSSDHGKLGLAENEGDPKNGQEFNKANVRKVKRNKLLMDRPLAQVVRQIVCSKSQTALLLHEGVVYMTVKVGSKSHAYAGVGLSGKPSSVGDFVQMNFPKGTMPVQFLCAGTDHFLAITDDVSKNLYSWGLNDCGQLGLGHRESMSTPQRVFFPDHHYSERITFAACGDDFSFCVTATNHLFSWGSNEKGQLAQWSVKSDGLRNFSAATKSGYGSLVLAPQLCQAWEKYREINLPYFERNKLDDRHCPIKDGWKTYHRLMIACGHDHAFSWQTTDEQLKHAHGYTSKDTDDAATRFTKYEALCPRSQHYVRDMERVMDRLQDMFSQYSLMQIKFDKLKFKSKRWRLQALRGDAVDGVGSSTGNGGGGAAAALSAMTESLHQSEKYIHTKKMLSEAKEKRKRAKKMIKILSRERTNTQSTLLSLKKKFRMQTSNLYELSSQISIDRHRIENLTRDINHLKEKMNGMAAQGSSAMAILDDKIRTKRERKAVLARELDVNIELHNYGRTGMVTKEISSLETKVESIESKIQDESEKLRMYTRESKSLSDFLQTIVRQTKEKTVGLIASSAMGGAMKSSDRTGERKNLGAKSDHDHKDHLSAIVDGAKRLIVRLDLSSLKLVSQRSELNEDPVELAQSMLAHTQELINREFRIVEGDLLGDIKQIFRDILIQNCRLRRLVNGLREASISSRDNTESEPTATRGQEMGGVVSSVALLESDSGSDEYCDD